MQTNPCGTCTLCCKVMPFFVDGTGVDPDLVMKPAGKWCPQCDRGNGCRLIHAANRPSACDEFECAWLASQGRETAMPESMRPDKTGAVIVVERKGFVLRVNPSQWADYPWRKEPLRSAIAAWDQAGIKVWVKSGDREIAVGTEAIESLRLGDRKIGPSS